MDAQLARAGAEQVALHADDVADIEHLKKLEIAFADGVLLDVKLQALAILLEMREAGLPHVADGHQASGNADAHFGRQILGRLRAVSRQNLRHGVGELVPAAVGAVSEGLDLANAGEALLQ